MRSLRYDREPQEKAVLLSGGYDSTAILSMLSNFGDYSYHFYSYGQKYAEQESDAIQAIKRYYGITVDRHYRDWATDIKNRNFLMLAELNALGIDEVIVGCRRLTPLTDKYKDTNLLALKLFAFTMRMKVRTPICFKTKRQTIAMIPERLLPELYTTEEGLCSQ